MLTLGGERSRPAGRFGRRLSRRHAPRAGRAPALAAAVAALLALVAPAEAAAAALYPDLRTLPPRELRLDRTNVNPPEEPVEEHNVLRFTNTVWNAGEGPLDLSGKVEGATGNAPVTQQVVQSDGSAPLRFGVGEYLYHREHLHYHFDDWGRYELWTEAEWAAWNDAGRPPGAAPTALGQKTSSCGIDEEFIAQLPVTPGRPRYIWEGCHPGRDGVIHQGVSVGWGDTYDYYRFEQWVDLGQAKLADGRYVLRSIADPTNRLYESPGKDDPEREGAVANEAVTVFTVAGGRIQDTAAPTGTLMVNGVDRTSTSAVVTLGAIGRDDVTGVDRVRFSNDGTRWREFAFARDLNHPSAPVLFAGWDLADPATGGTGLAGTRSVHAQFRDATGKWGPSASDTIQLPGTPLRLAVVGDGAGKVASRPAGLDCAASCTASFLSGMTVTLTAAETAGSHFAGWSGACAGAGATCTVTLDAARDVVAAFALDRAPVGTASPAIAGEATVGSTLTVTSGTWSGAPSPSFAYAWRRCDRLGGACVDIAGATDASYRVTDLDAGHALRVRVTAANRAGAATMNSAATSAVTVPVTVTVGGTGGGTVTSSPDGVACRTTCRGAFTPGTEVTLTAAADPGSTFTGWTGSCSGTGSCRVTTTTSRTVEATFALVPPPPPPPVAGAGVDPAPVAPPPARPVVTAPAPPRALRATVRRVGRLRWIDVRWTLAGPRPLRFVVQRSLDGRRWSTLPVRLPGTARLLRDGIRRPGRYLYRVRVVSAGGASGWSAPAAVRSS